MKHLTMTLALLAGLSLPALADEKVESSQLPEAVLKSLNAAKGTDVVKDIEKQTKDGKTVYEVEFTRSGFNPKLWIAEDGSIVRDNRKSAIDQPTVGSEPITTRRYVPLLPRTATLQLSDTPQAVQNAIQQHAAGRKVVDIDKETWSNKTVYEVEFEQAGRNAQIHVAEDGTIVKSESAGEGLGKRLFGLYLGTQLEDTPVAVQETIKREARGNQIVDIDKELRIGEPVYEVEIKQPTGNYEIHIAQNGTILRDSRRTDAVGTPDRKPQTGVGAGSDRDVTKP